MQDRVNPGRASLACIGTERTVNKNPRSGEPAVCLPLYYALFSVFPRATRIISSAGIDTYATWAAVDYLTSAGGVTELIRRFDPRKHLKLPEFFQAVIRSEIIRGDPANASLMLVRELDGKELAAAEGLSARQSESLAAGVTPGTTVK